MKYIALLRGVNVGGHRKVEMKRLKNLLENTGYSNVKTYLNSGNVLFETDENSEQTKIELPRIMAKEFGFEIPTLIKSELEIKKIASIIPNEWQNNSEQKTDVAYLFPEIDSEETVDKIPVKREYVDFIYVKGAIVWHILKKDYNKSQLNKIVSHKFYKLMTVRNVNTARFLAGE